MAQSSSEVAKSAIRQAGIKVLMRQTLDVDLTRYCQYIQGAIPRTKKAIQAYPSGKAVVILPDGSQHKVQFNTRQSEHVSQTPQAQAALVKFAAMDIDVAALPMRDMTAEVQPDQAQGRLAPAPPTTATQRVYALLAESTRPTLRCTLSSKDQREGKRDHHLFPAQQEDTYSRDLFFSSRYLKVQGNTIILPTGGGGNNTGVLVVTTPVRSSMRNQSRPAIQRGSWLLT